MPHQCVHCGKLYPNAAQELLSGCSCGSHFFFYIREELAEKIKLKQEQPVELKGVDKKQIEQDVREMIGAVEEETPVILDLESVKVLKPGKFEIDVVNLFRKDRPLIYKLEEGKYIIDLASTLRVDISKMKIFDDYQKSKISEVDKVYKKIKNPEGK